MHKIGWTLRLIQIVIFFNFGSTLTYTVIHYILFKLGEYQYFFPEFTKLVQIQKENSNENKVLKYCLFFIQTFFFRKHHLDEKKKIRTTSRIYRNFWILKLLNNRYTQKLAKSYGIFIKKVWCFSKRNVLAKKEGNEYTHKKNWKENSKTILFPKFHYFRK